VPIEFPVLLSPKSDTLTSPPPSAAGAVSSAISKVGWSEGGRTRGNQKKVGKGTEHRLALSSLIERERKNPAGLSLGDKGLLDA
jgi:hypothetical protein